MLTRSVFIGHLHSDHFGDLDALYCGGMLKWDIDTRMGMMVLQQIVMENERFLITSSKHAG